MTQDEIKKIAEEYADIHMQKNIPLVKKTDNIRNAFVQDATRVLSDLSESYFIVEKSKVRELYKDCEQMIDVYPSMVNGYANKLTTLEQLFGTDAFKEE